MKITGLLVTILVSFLVAANCLAEAPLTELDYQNVVQNIKQAKRGPFRRIRWFCHNGKILPPKPYACSETGGVQHGEWTETVKQIRKEGYLIANLLADFSKRAPEKPIDLDTIKQILIEQFLVGYDDGWIFQNARYYRGAIQSEREIDGSEIVLKWMLEQFDFNDQNFLLLWEAYRLLPHENDAATATKVRDQSTRLEKLDSGFKKLRAKLHGQPEAADAERVRNYALKKGKRKLRKDYLALANQVELLFSIEASLKQLKKFRRKKLGEEIDQFIRHFPTSSLERFQQGSKILQLVRERFNQQPVNKQLDLLKFSALLEQIVFAAGNQLIHEIPKASRTERLNWLISSADALYGIGFISHRGWKTITETIESLTATTPTIEQYRNKLRDLNRVTSWANQWLHFHLETEIEHFSQLEPLATAMIPTRLRGSPLQFYSAVLDELLKDADRLSGSQNSIFGEISGGGMRALNPGFARGTLKLAPTNEEFDPDGIYLLPETLATLPPVAGILTMGEGNSVSHIQLLAANLGIPNVAIDESVKQLIERQVNTEVSLAVSPGGAVELEKSASDHIPVSPLQNSDVIKPDLQKLDLSTKKILRLSKIRNKDSGRTAGPKAARLGELSHQFSGTVVEGLVIPFGYFRDFLEQKEPDSNQSLFSWMKKEYELLSLVEGKHHVALVRRFLRLYNQKIIDMPFPKSLKQDLKESLASVFGDDGKYALFVRSDTNIEDLPGFNGAGLNLTVPNVTGFDALLSAIKKVWASPFKPRAFAWRQGRMTEPEHVYPSILLMQTVPVDKSGVMLTFDTVTGKTNKLTIATNYGIGGAVQGQAAEEIRVDLSNGKITLLADATSPTQKNVNRLGGLTTNPVTATGQVLTDDEVNQLINLAKQIEERYPQTDEEGNPTIADVEFGFENGALRLFQIRPYLRSRAATNNQRLINMDKLQQGYAKSLVNMHGEPR